MPKIEKKHSCEGGNTLAAIPSPAGEIYCTNLRTGLLLLLPEEGSKTTARDLDDLETHTGNITLRLTLTTETFDQDFVVLVNKVKTTVERHEGRNLLTVLDQLHTDTLSNGRVRLLGLDTDLLKHNTLSLRRATSGRGLVEVAEGALFEVSVTPAVVTTVRDLLASCIETPRLGHTVWCLDRVSLPMHSQRGML